MDREGLRRGEVHLWWFPTQHVGPEELALLEPAEREAATRFRHERDATRFLSRRVARRRILSAYTDTDAAALRFDTTCARCGKAHGKPRLAHPEGTLRFNASEADGLGVVVVADAREVGVDVESPHRATDVEAVAARFFAPGERARLDGDDAVAGFLRAWSAKEAYLKLRGLGLAAPLERLDTASWEEAAWLPDPLEPGQFAVHRPRIPGTEAVAAVAVDLRGRDDPVPPLRVARWTGVNPSRSTG